MPSNSKLPFEKYKPRLNEYLRQKGVDVTINPTHCFNHAGHKHGDANPSLQLFDDSFKCHGCGIQGDIYDAVEILEGITGKKEQFLFIESFFGGAGSASPAKPYNSVWGKAGEEFKPDAHAMKSFEAYLRKNKAAPKMIKQFLDTRAAVTTKETVTSYPADVEKFITEHFFYWTGLDIVRQDLGTDILKKCGIPLVNPNTNHSTWEHSGVVMKLGTGYKLHYYEKKYCHKCKEKETCDGFTDKGSCWSCEKRTSRGGKTFPMPGEIDKSLRVILVEGEMNALSCAAIGIKNLFAAGGTNGLTGPKVKQQLLDVPEIILFFDADDAGRKAMGLASFDDGDKRKSNIPQIIQKAGYAGKIKIAELPPVAETGYKDQDGLIIAGKRETVLKAIADAKEYVPLPEREKPAENKKAAGTIWEAYDSISIERLKDLLGKIERKTLDHEDIQPFVSACIKACKHESARQELLKWDAKQEEIDAQNDVSPYFLLEACGKYGVSKYLRREIEKSLVPESELLKSISPEPVNIKINYEKIKNSPAIYQFLKTHGGHSAAELVHDVVDGNIVFLKSDNMFYFYNGHVWEYEPNMSGVVYLVICSVIRYFLQHKLADKGMLWDLLIKTEGRRFRIEVVQDFSEFHDIHQLDANFDSPLIKETLTLADGVIDFSGAEIKFRKSRREEFRRDYLPYSMKDVKNIEPKKFMDFMNSNFKNKETLETLMCYLSLIPSRNTQFKYGGVFIGKRNTGKTTTVELIGAVLKSAIDKKESMVASIPAGILITQGKRLNSGNEATPYIAALEGKGAGAASETEKGGLLNNALFKLLTGGDTLVARALYQGPRTFSPTAQIIVMTNFSPRFDAQDSATVDRMVIIPFSIIHEKGEKGSKLLGEIINSLRGEFPGIVRILAEYYLKLRVEFNGIIPLSDECLSYKDNYVDEQRTDLDKFVNDNIEFAQGGEFFEKVEDLYSRFLAYYDINEEDAEKEALTRKKFTYLLRRDYLEMKNYKKKRFADKVLPCFFNIRLKPFDPNADIAAAPSGCFDKQTGGSPQSKQAATPGEAEENPFG